MGGVFVGALCAIGLFMFFYTGYDKWDNLTGNIAGFLAIIVAWFPTTENGPLKLTGIIHLTAAALLFIALAVFSLFLFTQKKPDPTAEKLKRNKIYIICGIMILACLLAILLFALFISKGDPDSRFVFWAETIALLSFGVSWLTKGETFYPDK
jgi:heme A synthase